MKTKKTTKKSASKAKPKKFGLQMGNPITVAAEKILALFAEVKDVAAAYDFENRKVRLYVTDVDKADALNTIIKRKHQMGNLALTVEVVEATGTEVTPLSAPTHTISQKGIFDAFCLVFGDMQKPITVSTSQKDKWYFCQFAPVLLCWQADDLQNPEGYEAAPLADIVKFACEPNGVLISTYVNAQ